MNKDDLRSTLLEESDEENALAAGELPASVLIDKSAEPTTNGKFLGMTAGERAFLSVMLFLCVSVLGIGLLIATGRIVF